MIRKHTPGKVRMQLGCMPACSPYIRCNAASRHHGPFVASSNPSSLCSALQAMAQTGPCTSPSRVTAVRPLSSRCQVPLRGGPRTRRHCHSLTQALCPRSLSHTGGLSHMSLFTHQPLMGGFKVCWFTQLLQCHSQSCSALPAPYLVPSAQSKHNAPMPVRPSLVFKNLSIHA